MENVKCETGEMKRRAHNTHIIYESLLKADNSHGNFIQCFVLSITLRSREVEIKIIDT